MIARLLAAWRGIRLEAEMIEIDREIEAMRAWRVVEQQRERELVKVRADFARQLQAMKSNAVERRNASVRAVK